MRPQLAGIFLLATLLASFGCGAHSRDARPRVDVLAVAITPVTHIAPDGVLKPAKYVPAPAPPPSARPTPMPRFTPTAIRGPAASHPSTPEQAPASSYAPAGTAVVAVRLWPDSISRPVYGEDIDVDEHEEPLFRGLAEYPDSARIAGVQGTVIVAALVGTDGKVYDMFAIHSIRELDAAAFAAVRRWRFKPAHAHGRPVAVWTEVPVKFTLH